MDLVFMVYRARIELGGSYVRYLSSSFFRLAELAESPLLGGQ